MSTNPPTGATKPPVERDQEIRFAVVMYGGSSLAIYINGVAQELLRLVRATAPEFNETSNREQAHLADEELRGSERVYRQLGRMLSRQGVQWENLDETNRNAVNSGPVRTRFVVDILTGTSAGGINAVYLAKALANNQDMDKLKDLWVTEGDIGVLINDDLSYEGLEFKLADDKGEPWSLLNSRRMYFALLSALREMDADKPACDPGKSPLVDELDLYVTATDMFGRPVQIRLADDVVGEYRHRNVFQFRYRSRRASDIDHSDFKAEYNAFLAFVARATSAHQAAFSPIRLNDIDPITKKYPQTYPPSDEHEKPSGEYPAEDAKLRAFYRDYLLQRATNAGVPAAADSEALAKAFQSVWFVDGGTLDNKPFSFVAEELPLRHADTYVDRKLLYIEPSPEMSEWKEAPDKRPQIVGNAMAALSSLPRYETIVEDLMRLLDRNRLVERLGHIMREMESDLIYMPLKQALTRDEFLELLKDRSKLKEWLESKGPSWGSYQRLRAAAATDDLALLVTRAAVFSEESEEFIAIRYLVRSWRASKYDSHMQDDKASIVEFLVEFDLMWSIRRIRFVLKKLNELACLDKDARRIAGVAHHQETSDVWPDKTEENEFRNAVTNLRDELNKAYVELRGDRRILWATDETNPFRKAIGTLDIGSRHLLDLLREPTDDDRRKRATALLSDPLGKNAETRLRESLEEEAAVLRRESREEEAEQLLVGSRKNSLTRADAIEELTRQVKTKLTDATNKARYICSAAMRPPKSDARAEALPPWNLFLRKTLWYYYTNFDDFDQISYPILYSTGVGEEADVIDVFRVSPEDATALIDECAQYNESGEKMEKCAVGKKVKKLAGTTLGNFGAFFERRFRINDIMWGRLDGAERVIAALLPANPALRDGMTEQAHRAIIVEEMMSADDAAGSNLAMQGVVWDALDHWDDRRRRDQLLSQAAGMLPGDSSFAEYLKTLAGGADPHRLFRKRFLKDYDVSRKFTQDDTIKSARRINRVLGNMALGYFPGSRQQRFVTFVGERLFTFTEAAIQPDGEASRKQFWRFLGAYLFSFFVLAFVSLPAFIILRSAEWPWPAFGFLAILLVTLVLAAVPLVVTFLYNLAWFKLKRKLDALLRPAQKH